MISDNKELFQLALIVFAILLAMAFLIYIYLSCRLIMDEREYLRDRKDNVDELKQLMNQYVNEFQEIINDNKTKIDKISSSLETNHNSDLARQESILESIKGISNSLNKNHTSDLAHQSSIGTILISLNRRIK